MNFKKLFIFIILLSFMSANTLFAGKRNLKLFKKAHKLISKIKKTQKQLIFEKTIETAYQGGDYLGYSKFIAAYLSQWHKLKSNKSYPRRYRNWWRRERINPLDLFSGGIAIRESLQLDTIKKSAKTQVQTSQPVVKLSDLKNSIPKVKSHPFKDMLKNKEYKYSDLSKFAPDDFYYIHVTGFTKALNLWDNLMLKLKPLYKRFQTSSVDYRIKDKLMLQLALKENKALRSFYDLVVKEAIIVGSDPFIVTGSDVSIVFNIKNEILFKATIQKYRKEIKKEQKARERTIKISGYKVNYLFTKNRVINSYYVKIDKEHFILSNSYEALKKIISTYKNPKLSLFEADEFKYMRSIYKLNDDEGIFLYLSDPFIRNLVGPEIRLKEARRITTQFKLVKIQNLLLLYHQLYKKYPSSIQSMILKLAPKENSQKHYKYFMDMAKDLKLSKNKKTVTSIIYGNLGYFRPNTDNTRFKFVTQNEADNYRNFVRNYNNYWKDYFDPIGIRISTHNDKITIDTHILPLINSSMYKMVQQMIGGKGVILNNKKLQNEWLKISLKLSQKLKQHLPQAYSEFKREFGITHDKQPDFARIIGNHITFSIMDSSPLVDFNISALLTDMFTRRSRGMGLLSFFVTSLAHPVRISIPLKKDIDILRKELEYITNQLTIFPNNREISWRVYKKSYKSTEYTVFTLKFWNMITFRIYFTFTNNSLEITSTENYLKYVIDNSNNSGRHVHPGNREIAEHKKIMNNKRNISLSFYPNSINLEKEYFTNMLIDNLIKNNLKNIRTLTLIKDIYGKKLSENEFYKRFNFNINSPFDKGYIYNKNTVTHPVLSGYTLKTLNMDILKKELLDNYYSIKKAQIDFEFTNTGIDTRITIE